MHDVSSPTSVSFVYRKETNNGHVNEITTHTFGEYTHTHAEKGDIGRHNNWRGINNQKAR